MTGDETHLSEGPLQSAAPRQKLRPNAYARLARYSAANGLLMLLIYAGMALAWGAYAVSVLVIDPDQRPRITLDETTFRLQGELDRQFPGVEQTFLGVVESRDPETARQQAVALAASLDERKDLFLSAFVPGTGDFYATNALLFQDIDSVRVRVETLIQTEPLYYALAAAPDIVGFATLVNEIGKAVEQGRSPPGLEALLLAASSAIEGEVKGSPRPVQWTALAGLDGEVRSQLWYVLATPMPGMERQAAQAAREASEVMQGVSWLWPRRALAAAPSAMRDFVVPASLSVLLALVMSAAVLGSIPQALVLMFCGAVTLSAAAAVAAAMGRTLDGATWSFALPVLAPVFTAGTLLCTAYGGGRAKGISPLQSVMLAAHAQGASVTAAVLLYALVWLSWLPRQLPSLSQFAVIALVGCAVAWLVSMTLLPAALAVFSARPEDEQGNWLDEALAGEASPPLRSARDALAMSVLAVAIFCAVFLPAVRFGERQAPAVPPQLETPDGRGAVQVLVPEDRVGETLSKLGSLPEVGAIRTAAQFLPPDADAKIAELRRLSGLSPLEPAIRPPAEEYVLRQSFADLDEQLTAIAVGPSTSPELKDAALRLRRAVVLLVSPDPPARARVEDLERALFGGLRQLSDRVQRLSRLPVPQVSDLDPRLLRRFVSESGLWRVEVMPRSGTGELSFAAALRRSVPEAAGEPRVSLVRNEVIHRQTILALGSALAAAAMLVFGTLRNARAAVLALAPAGAFLTLAAAVTVLLGIGLNAAMLAGISAAIAVLITSSMRVATNLPSEKLEAGSAALAGRAALLPPLALAGAVAPLFLSSRPAVGELGLLLAMLLAIAAILSQLLVPALARWLDALARRFPAGSDQR